MYSFLVFTPSLFSLCNPIFNSSPIPFLFVPPTPHSFSFSFHGLGYSGIVSFPLCLFFHVLLPSLSGPFIQQPFIHISLVYLFPYSFSFPSRLGLLRYWLSLSGFPFSFFHLHLTSLYAPSIHRSFIPISLIYFHSPFPLPSLSSALCLCFSFLYYPSFNNLFFPFLSFTLHPPFLFYSPLSRLLPFLSFIYFYALYGSLHSTTLYSPFSHLPSFPLSFSCSPFGRVLTLKLQGAPGPCTVAPRLALLTHLRRSANGASPRPPHGASYLTIANDAADASYKW